MTKKLFFVFLIAMMLYFAGCSGSSAVDENNDIFSNAVKSVTTDEVILNDLATFEWDTMYNFTLFTSKEAMEAVIGFSSADIKAIYNEGHTQLIFVKDNEVACSI